MRKDGTVDPVAGTPADFGKAVAEALRLGFDPERHTWVIEHRHWATRYAPGATPVTIARVAPEAAAAHHDDTALR